MLIVAEEPFTRESLIHVPYKPPAVFTGIGKHPLIHTEPAVRTSLIHLPQALSPGQGYSSANGNRHFSQNLN